jgi:glycerophosphoryl diester phosphodiesterase
VALVATLCAAAATADVFGVAHRGGRVQGPENTLEVMQLTMALGTIPWLETDSWLSSDFVPMLHHDRSLCRTTNIEDFGYDCVNPSNNPLGRFPEVRDFTLAELKMLDVGAWFGPAWVGTRMPTLEEALLLVKDTGFRLIVEIKAAGQPAIVKNILDSNAIPYETIIIWARGFGFDHWHPVIPGIRQVTGQFTPAQVTDTLLAQRAAAGDYGIATLSDGLSQQLVDKIHSYGFLHYAIPTAFGGDPLLDQIALGVDGIHTPNELGWTALLGTLPCTDRADNDGDGESDFDGVDLDFDRIIDLPPDYQCVGRLDYAEVAQCQDGYDNDADGYTDLADADCNSADDTTEAQVSSPPSPVPAIPLAGRIALIGLLVLLGVYGRGSGAPKKRT